MKTRRHGRVAKTHTIPYGTLAGASEELRVAYYYFGYKNDDDLPPLPVVEPDPIDCYDPIEDVDERVDKMLQCFSVLWPREKQLLAMRFIHEFTLEECGMHMQVTRERIRQLEARMLRRIRDEYKRKERKHEHRLRTTRHGA